MPVSNLPATLASLRLGVEMPERELDLVQRLRGIYSVGPASNPQEFGTRAFHVPPIDIKAADYIDACERVIEAMCERLATAESKPCLLCEFRAGAFEVPAMNLNLLKCVVCGAMERQTVNGHCFKCWRDTPLAKHIERLPPSPSAATEGA